MIIIKYKGGLGNQMFQYAMQLAIEKKYPNQQVLADVSHFLLLNEHNGYEMENVWGIQLEMATKQQLNRVSPYYYPGRMVLHLPKTLRRVIAKNLQHKYKAKRLQTNKAIRQHYYKQQTHCSYEAELWNLAESQDWYLDGLWQNINYFKEIDQEIREAFEFHNEADYAEKDLVWKEQIKNCNSISIHVRRGDFQNSKFDICTPEYYEQAIIRMDQELQTESERYNNKKYFFFTDDVSYVEETFKEINNKEIIHHDIENSILDMELMSLCNHHIISNSTFAWWAAWLDSKSDTIVIGPEVSIKKANGSYPLSAPENWILLEV